MKPRVDDNGVGPAKAKRNGIGSFLPLGIPTNPMANAGMKVLAAAIVLGIVLAVVAFSFPAAPKQTGHQETSAVATSSEGGRAMSSSSCTGTTETYGNLTLTRSPCVMYGFPSVTVKNATLDTRPVLAYIGTAYEYHVAYFGVSQTDSNVMYAVLNVTGRQVVTGNWTTGYRVSYLGNALLNVTVQQVVASTYEVTHVSSYPLPDRNATVTYAPQQARAIQVALSDSKVKSLLTAPPYYVEFVGAARNESYLVQLYQVDGTGVVGGFVSSNSTSVSGIYSEQRVSGECWPNGMVITDPWGAATHCSCKA